MEMEEDQAPEEIPMDVVLSEIRQILTKDIDAADLKKEPIAPAGSAIREDPDYFLLTPDMRCDLPKAEVKTIHKRTEQILSKLQSRQNSVDLSPALERWLNTHLPQMIEDILNRRLS